MKRLALVLAGVLVGGSGVWLAGRAPASLPQLDAPFHAVLLDNGQVYFGKLNGLGTPFPVIRDVYYIQRSGPVIATSTLCWYFLEHYHRNIFSHASYPSDSA